MLPRIVQLRRLPYNAASRNRVGRPGRAPMQTLTEIVAAVVVHSSAVAYAHFGVSLEAHQVEKPVPAERTIARTTAPKPVVKTTARLVSKPAKTATGVRRDCPDQQATIVKTVPADS